jgi:hypothetical protein
MELGLTLAAHMRSTLLQVLTAVLAAVAVLHPVAQDHVPAVEPSCNIRPRCVCQLLRSRQD